MCEDDYEVPSPHEEAVDKAAEREHEPDGFVQKIALMTAVLSTVGALINYQSGSSQTEAMFLKNASILKQSEASDQWAYYQAKSTKGHIAEATAALASDPGVKAQFLAEKAKDDKEKLEIQAEAKKLQAAAHKLGDDAEAKIKPHELLALALTFIQIAVALAAITVLTRRRWLIWGSIGSAAIGIIAAAITLF